MSSQRMKNYEPAANLSANAKSQHNLTTAAACEPSGAVDAIRKQHEGAHEMISRLEQALCPALRPPGPTSQSATLAVQHLSPMRSLEDQAVAIYERLSDLVDRIDL